jgi:hypothetical protein
VAHWLPGANPQSGEFAKTHHLPPEVGLGGAKTLYPEYRHELDRLMNAQTTPSSGKVAPVGKPQ